MRKKTDKTEVKPKAAKPLGVVVAGVDLKALVWADAEAGRKMIAALSKRYDESLKTLIPLLSEKNDDATVQLLTKASVAGGQARSCLGELYLEGDGVEKDTNKAFELFKSAADFGDSNGMYRLALMYKDGISCEANQEMYRRYVRMAAERGNREAKQLVAKWNDRVVRRKANRNNGKNH